MTTINFIVLVLLIVVASPPLVTGAGCDSGWSAYNGGCYKLFVESATQTNGLEKCHKQGAQLVSIHSKDENEFVAGLVKTAPRDKYWIGLKLSRHSLNEKIISCHWLDGSAMGFGDVKTIGAGAYPWAHHVGFPPEPNNFVGLESCVNFGTNSATDEPGWVDEPCEKVRNGYICKK